MSQIKNAQNLRKFGIYNMPNMMVPIVMSKIIFMKYLPPVRPRLIPKLIMNTQN